MTTETIPEDLRAKEETVWIAYLDHGYDGKSEPLRVFGSKALADIWLLGGQDAYGSSARAVELPVIRSQPVTQEGT